MSMRGRRPEVGTERTPSGAISRSKSNLAKRAEKIREAAKAEARREARIGRTLQEKTQEARVRVYGLTPAQAASHHAATPEGRLYLRKSITPTQLLAIEHYKRTLARFSRDTGGPLVSANPLAAYLPSEPRNIAAPPSGAAASLSSRHYDAVEDVLHRAGKVDQTPVSWAMGVVCRRGEELPARCLRAFQAGAKVLVEHYRLGPDPDLPEQKAA